MPDEGKLKIYILQGYPATYIECDFSDACTEFVQSFFLHLYIYGSVHTAVHLFAHFQIIKYGLIKEYWS